jgi:hypothetical protein
MNPPRNRSLAITLGLPSDDLRFDRQEQAPSPRDKARWAMASMGLRCARMVLDANTIFTNRYFLVEQRFVGLRRDHLLVDPTRDRSPREAPERVEKKSEALGHYLLKRLCPIHPPTRNSPCR